MPQSASPASSEVGLSLPAQFVQRYRVPPPPLSNFVEVLWHFEGSNLGPGLERCLPTGTMEMVFNLGGDTSRVYDGQDARRFENFRGAVICGAQSGFFVIDREEQESVLGVHFRAGGAFPFLGVPAGELNDVHMSLESLWGGFARRLRERLLEAKTADARFLILEQALLERATRPLQRHRAVAFALREFHEAPHLRTIATICRQAGLSPRRFIELFRNEVGLTPKLFCRIRRFQQVLRRVHRAQRISWAHVAADCGYFDQAHFIRDFQAFSGVNPSGYLAVRTEHLNHLPHPG